MIDYILRKLLYGFAVMLNIVVVVFFLFNVFPADLARMTQGQRNHAQSLEAVRKEFSLDKPIPVQFPYYLNDLLPAGFHQNTALEQQKYAYARLFSISKNNAVALKWPYLRRSYQTLKDVAATLLAVIPHTLILGTTAMIFASFIGIFFGVMAIIMRLSRNAILNVLNQDYIRTKKTKGLDKNSIIYTRALKNAWTPVVTAIAAWFASLLAGSFFVKYIFGYNGLGKAMVDALKTSDFPVVMVTILFIAFIFGVSIPLVDLLYVRLIPRLN